MQKFPTISKLIRVLDDKYLILSYACQEKVRGMKLIGAGLESYRLFAGSHIPLRIQQAQEIK